MTIDEVRSQWRGEPRTALAWEPTADQSGNDSGECKGEFFKAANFPYLAYLKPGKIGRPAWAWPLPAYEKIAADLAFDLRCPVPAAQVWERDDAARGEYPRYCYLSLKEFPQRYAWSLCQTALAASPNPMIQTIVHAALAKSCGMLVLDTWIGQSDRGDHGTNVQLGYDPAEPARAQLTYLDFGRTFNWNGRWADDGWKDMQLAMQPSLVMNSMDKKIVTATYDTLMNLEAEEIRAVCTRLAGVRFPEAEAETVGNALVARRDLLRPILDPYMV
jgi:hypothetical protein